MYRIIAIFILALFSLTAIAKGLALKNGYPHNYTVQPGDTLWGIANKFLDDPLLWTKLYHANPDVHNPDKIYPGEIITVLTRNGKPYIKVLPGGTIKLSPHVRSAPLDRAIPAVPLSIIKPFLNNSRIVEDKTLDTAPFIVAHGGEHVVVGLGDQIYVENLHKFPNLSNYAILRKGRTYVDPKTRAVLGIEAIDIGQAHLIKPGIPSTLVVSSTRMEVLRGDRLLPLSEQSEEDFNPRVSDLLIEGQLIGVMGGVTQIGQYQVVVFDRGIQDGVQVGDLYAIYQQGRVINNPVKDSFDRYMKLPNERAGELMIFRTFRRLSYGLVMHATHPIHLLDVVKTPIE